MLIYSSFPRRREAEAREATVLLLNTPESDGVLIRGLLEKGASVNECIKAGYGPTALLANAPDSLPTEDLLHLIDAGADISSAEAVLDRRALKAAGDGDIDTLSRLAGAEVDIDKTLRKMARSCDDKAVITLLAAGANPDAKDKNGRSALDEAAAAEKRGSAGAAAARKTLEYASAPSAPAAAPALAVAARTPK